MKQPIFACDTCGIDISENLCCMKCSRGKPRKIANYEVCFGCGKQRGTDHMASTIKGVWFCSKSDKCERAAWSKLGDITRNVVGSEGQDRMLVEASVPYPNARVRVYFMAGKDSRPETIREVAIKLAEAKIKEMESPHLDLTTQNCHGIAIGFTEASMTPDGAHVQDASDVWDWMQGMKSQRQ